MMRGTSILRIARLLWCDVNTEHGDPDRIDWSLGSIDSDDLGELESFMIVATRIYDREIAPLLRGWN